MENETQAIRNCDTGGALISPPPYHVNEFINSKTYNIYLVENIDTPDKYVKLFELLRSTSPNDIVRIYVNCRGGNVVTGMELITAIRQCPAKVITVLEGIAMSLAPLILFSGDEIELPDNTMIMFHDFSQGHYPTKGNEIHKEVTAWRDLYKALLIECASPILTPKEIEEIADGKDKYFTGAEIQKRLEGLTKQAQEKKAPVKPKRKTTVRKKK